MFFPPAITTKPKANIIENQMQSFIFGLQATKAMTGRSSSVSFPC
jgi:hypothetical protein